MFSKYFPNFKVSPLIASAAIAGAALAMAGLGASTASASVIYSDSFTGGTANLDGAAPTVDNGTSSVWTAGQGWQDNGFSSSTGNDSSAYLMFTPTSGHVYTLSSGVDVNSSSGSFGLDLGFIGSPNTQAYFDNCEGYAYAFVRDNQVFQYGGPGNTNVFYGPISSTPIAYTISIELNTTATAWTYDFTVNGVSTGPTAFATNPTIAAVGMANVANGSNGTFSNFSLTESSVPEPASLGLLAVGGLGLLFLGKRRHA